jgi:hypothetical protein
MSTAGWSPRPTVSGSWTTDGYMELQKNTDIAGRAGADHLFAEPHRDVDTPGAYISGDGVGAEGRKERAAD